MSYADYSRNSPVTVTCRHCGWTGREGEDCDCERMEEAQRIEAILRDEDETE